MSTLTLIPSASEALAASTNFLYDKIYNAIHDEIIATIAVGGTKCNVCIRHHDKSGVKDAISKVVTKGYKVLHIAGGYISIDWADA